MAVFERQARGPGSLLGDRAKMMRKDPSLWIGLNGRCCDSNGVKKAVGQTGEVEAGRVSLSC